MNNNQDALHRRRLVSRKVLRRTTGSLRYLYMLLSVFPPTLALSTRGGELLGSYQITIGVILYIPAVILAVSLVMHHKEIFNQRLLEQAVCPKCSYDLTGNISGTCPECGTAIE